MIAKPKASSPVLYRDLRFGGKNRGGSYCRLPFFAEIGQKTAIICAKRHQKPASLTKIYPA